jgi:hypothetical protein
MSTLDYTYMDNGSTVTGSLEIKVDKSRDITSEAEITEFPVETGVNISDHVRPKPITIKLDCVIGNMEIPSGSAHAVLMYQRQQGFQVVTQPTVLRAGDEARITLDAIWSNGGILSLTLGEGVNARQYNNMAISSLVFSEETKKGDALHFQMTMKEIIMVQNQTVSIPKGYGLKNKGKQGAVTATSSQSGRSTSAITGFMGGQAGVTSSIQNWALGKKSK